MTSDRGSGHAGGTVRAGAVIFGVAGLLFALYPAVRPYVDESTLSGAAAFASTAWVASHVFAMIGFVLLPLGLADAIRFGPTQVVMFGAGLALLAAGGILAAAYVWRSGILPRWSGVPLGAGLVLFLPQFFTAPPVRIAHGLLVAAGCAWLAFGLWRAALGGRPA